jgi:hypothetical protein
MSVFIALAFSLQGLLLVGVLIMIVIGVAVWMSRQEVSRWVQPIVVIGTGMTLLLVVSAFWQSFFGLAERALELVFDNGALSFLTVLPLLALLASAVWMIRTSTDRGVLALYLSFVLIFGGLLFFPARFFVGMLRFEWAVASALNGQIEPSDTSRFEWDCRGDCPAQDWIPSVPMVRDVRCVQRLSSSGACCQAYYTDGLYSEIHVWRIDHGRYKVQFASYPSCFNPGFDPTAEPGTPEDRQFVPCDQGWRS